jgi:hypothetical protein
MWLLKKWNEVYNDRRDGGRNGEIVQGTEKYMRQYHE